MACLPSPQSVASVSPEIPKVEMDLAPPPPPPLPDDILASVLRRLAPRDLAASRCVCTAWRRVVDDRRLLRAADLLLPRALGGIFLNLHDLRFTQFLSHPTTTGAAAVSRRLDYTVPGEPDRMPYIRVEDHCNGLLLLDHCVVNPATRQWAPLPPRPPLRQPPPPGMSVQTEEFLVFDPTLSLDYELVIVPDVPWKRKDDECEESEWPPSMLILPVFSSKTGSWEERVFGRDGEAAGMLPAMHQSTVGRFFKHQCGYWRGALYICCSDCFVMRISLSDNTYQAIRLPTEEDEEFYLGESVNGIYCASLFQGSQLQVWFLNDQCVHGQTEWVLKHDGDIFPVLPNLNYDEQCDGPWILQDFYYWRQEYSDDEAYDVAYSNEAMLEENFVWDSDNDNVLEPGSRSKDFYVQFLGFHPYKEVVFLCDKFDRVFAYNWSSLKVQDLGKVFPKFYMDWDLHFHHKYVSAAFPYTPCWLGELPEKLNLQAQLED